MNCKVFFNYSCRVRPVRVRPGKVRKIALAVSALGTVSAKSQDERIQRGVYDDFVVDEISALNLSSTTIPARPS